MTFCSIQKEINVPISPGDLMFPWKPSFDGLFYPVAAIFELRNAWW